MATVIQEKSIHSSMQSTQKWPQSSQINIKSSYKHAEKLGDEPLTCNDIGNDNNNLDPAEANNTHATGGKQAIKLEKKLYRSNQQRNKHLAYLKHKNSQSNDDTTAKKSATIQQHLSDSVDKIDTIDSQPSTGMHNNHISDLKKKSKESKLKKNSKLDETRTESYTNNRANQQITNKFDQCRDEDVPEKERSNQQQRNHMSSLSHVKQFLNTYFSMPSTTSSGSKLSATTNNTPSHNIDSNKRIKNTQLTKVSNNNCSVSVPVSPAKTYLIDKENSIANASIGQKQHQNKLKASRNKKSYFVWLNQLFGHHHGGGDSGGSQNSMNSNVKLSSVDEHHHHDLSNNVSEVLEIGKVTDEAERHNQLSSNHNGKLLDYDDKKLIGENLNKQVDGKKKSNNKRSNIKIVVDTLSKEVQTDICNSTTDLNGSISSEILSAVSLSPSNNLNNSNNNNNLTPITSDQQVRECPMSTEKFREHGRNLIDYISDYLDTIDKRRVTPLNIEPGYLRSLLDVDAPQEGEKFEDIMKDFENHIMCGITHWQHPRFHAYFPAGNAYPSILADMLSDAIGCVGFSWAASPACTELEIIMLDWMGKMIGLPEEFLCLSGAESKGGGVIQGSASECVLVNLLAARHVAIDRLRKKYPQTPDGVLLSKLIGYCSKEAHSCVEKAAMIGFIKMRALETDDKYSLRGDILSKAIKQDKANGLEPFLVSATLGTTSCCSFDNLEEVGKVCQEHDLWLHVDAAYAGSAFICQEFKYLMKGIELATSFNMNPNKWMLINFDCSLMWVKDRFQLTRAFVVDPLYLQHSFSDKAIDYRHWGIPLSRRFRALKLWFVIRNYGVEGLQRYIRNHVNLAKKFESLIKADSRFEIINQVVLGLVCFRLVGSNALNQRLLSNINASGKLHMVPASLNGRYIIRFCICSQEANESDVIYAHQCIAEFASDLFESIRAGRERIRAVSQQNTIDVSDISLHTQQSASADLRSSTNHHILNNKTPTSATTSTSAIGQTAIARLNGATPTPTTVPALAAGASSPCQMNVKKLVTSAASDSNGNGFNNTNNNNNNITNPNNLGDQLIARARSSLSAGNTSIATTTTTTYSPACSARTSPMMTSISRQQNHHNHQQQQHLVRGASSKLFKQQQQQQYQSSNTNNNDASEIDEDLEEELTLDNSSCLHDDIDDDEDLGALLLSDEEYKSGANEADEAVDEVFTLERRNKMSLRYKRGFFVRVVSDPKMYRVSISGDIGDSSGSIGSAGGGGGTAS